MIVSCGAASKRVFESADGIDLPDRCTPWTPSTIHRRGPRPSGTMYVLSTEAAVAAEAAAAAEEARQNVARQAAEALAASTVDYRFHASCRELVERTPGLVFGV